MKRNEACVKAITEREVPLSALLENLKILKKAKTEAEQDSIRETFAKEIEATYPMKARYNTEGKS